VPVALSASSVLALFITFVVMRKPATLPMDSHVEISRNEQSHVPRGPRRPHVNYAFLFQEIHALSLRAPSIHANGFLKKTFGLTGPQAVAVSQVAAGTLAKAEAMDAEARQIIDRERAKYPGGKIPPGQSLPAVPSSLIQLQQARDSLFIQGQADLQQILRSDYIHFDEKVKRRYDPAGLRQ
jgi:hypothetical protein